MGLLEGFDMLEVMMIAFVVLAIILIVTYKIRHKRLSGSIAELFFVILFTGMMASFTVVRFLEQGLSISVFVYFLGIFYGLYVIKNAIKRRSHIITVIDLENKMIRAGYDEGFIQEILAVCKKRINKYGQKEFQHWLYDLNYKLPEEFQNENKAIHIYENYSPWIEEEIIKLENETKLSWEEQAEDIKDIDLRARKAQLVIRHRLTDVTFDLFDY